MLGIGRLEDKIRDLERRVAELEVHKKYEPDRMSIIVDDGVTRIISSCLGLYPPYKRIPFQDALRLIVGHLGLKFACTEAIPERFTLDKNASPAVSNASEEKP